jgi:hypothetical protein
MSMDDAELALRGVWLTYQIGYSGQREEIVNYRGIAVFFDELSALRIANDTGSKVVWVPHGHSMMESIKAKDKQ